MRVVSPWTGQKETLDAEKRKRHDPEEIVRKLRDAEAMLNAGNDLAARTSVEFW
jgi:hypothetical protein